MMTSVIIPSHNEQSYLNRTVANIFDTTNGNIEVIVVLNGYDQPVDPRAKIVRLDENMGERVAMNRATDVATGEFLFRIDAHCDFSPIGWDKMLMEVTGEKDITVAVLTATDKEWKRLPGHWYGFCRLIQTADSDGTIGLEAKWQKPNRDHTAYSIVEPNMGLTGCGWMIQRDFYDEVGRADESLPKMGAIGEEFAIKAWAAGGRVQTRTDVLVGHIFGTGGYDTSGVKIAQQALWERYSWCYDDVAAKFPDYEGVKLVRADQPGKPLRTVTVDRVDTKNTTEADGKLLRRRIERYRYVWVENEHAGEVGWTDAQIEEKYAPLGTLIATESYIATEDGDLVPEAPQ